MKAQNGNKFVEESYDFSVRIKLQLMWSCVFLCLTVNTSCSVKTGINNLNNYHHPIDIDEEPLYYWEVESYTPRFLDDHMDISLGIGCNSGKKEGKIEVEEDMWWPEIATYFWDVHLGTRFFPNGVKDRKIIPYIGAGVGYFEYDMKTYRPGDYEYAYDDEFYNYYVDAHHDTIAHGYFSYLSAGTYLSLNKKFVLQLEFRNDFDKKYKQYDMGGYQITIGLAFMH